MITTIEAQATVRPFYHITNNNNSQINSVTTITPLGFIIITGLSVLELLVAYY